MILPIIFATNISEKPSLHRLAREMQSACIHFHGRAGFYVKDLRSGESIGYRDGEVFPSASTIKTAIMVEVVNQVEEGKLKWTDKLKVPPKELRNPSMWTAFLQDGISVNIDGLTNLMMNVSDNTAAVMLADKVGVENIQRRMQSWGLKQTACTIHPPSTNQFLQSSLKKFSNMGVTTPKEMGLLLERLYQQKGAKGKAASERMIRIMGHQYWDDFFASQIPPGTIVCSKVGALNRSRSDSALVFGKTPYIITAYTDDAKDQSWLDHCEGHDLLRLLSKLAWQYLEPDQPYTAPKDNDKWFPTGAGVEDS